MMRNFGICLLCGMLLVSLTACQRDALPPAASPPATPALTLREATNCRTGPGTEYDIIVTYQAGAKLEIAGRYEPGNFWLVKSNESPSGACWLWGEYAEATGNYGSVAIVTPPPTPAAGPLLIVDKWEYSCNAGTLTFALSWNDRATDEAGYRVFRNDELLVELPANSTTYTDTLDVTAGDSVEYYLQVFGPAGTLNSSVMIGGC
ncbi:MAG: SH3 domain-containing protein [Anaerolineales bacterium]